MLEHAGGPYMHGVKVPHGREYLMMRKFYGPVLKIFGLSPPKPKAVQQSSAAEQTAADEAAARSASEAEVADTAKRRGRRSTILAGGKTSITSLTTGRTSLLGSSTP